MLKRFSLIMLLMLPVVSAWAQTGQIEDFVGYYAPGNWTETKAGNPPGAGGFVDTSGAPESITLNGGDDGCNGWDFFDPDTHCDLDFTIPAGGTGTLSFDWSYHTDDVFGPSWDLFLLLNGDAEPIPISDASGGVSQNGSETVAVNAGDVVGFRIDCTDCIFGAATVTISNFSAPYDGPVPPPPSGPLSVPTLSQWALVILALGLAALAYFRRNTGSGQ